MKKILLFLLSFSFAFVLKAQNKDFTLAKQLVTKNSEAIGLSKNDLKNFFVADAYPNEGMELVYLQQQYKGLPVYNQIKTLAFKNGSPFYSSGEFIPDIAKLAGNSATASIKATDAVVNAFAAVKVPAPSFQDNPVVSENGRRLSFGMLKGVYEEVKAELLWLPTQNHGNITLNLVWQVQVAPNFTADIWLINVDAKTGAVISKVNLTVYDKWDHKDNVTGPGILRAVNNDRQGLGENPLAPVAQKPLSPTIVGTANYLVIPYPAESPKHPGGTAALRTNPWTAAVGNASTLGWQSNGTTDYIITRGNNVWATEDRAATNQNTGSPATSTTAPDPLNFNFPPNYNQDPTTPAFQQFAITNLFYWNNIMHDMSYQYGFTETSRNFQANNLGRGGNQGDDVMALAQSGSGTNNANFATTGDGNRPRMRMYLFDPEGSSTILHVNAPPSIVGDYQAVESNFSAANLLVNVGPVTGAVAYYDDGTGTHEACSGAPVNNVSGKIALIDRGNCNFTVKVLNAQAAGATAVIMVNNVAGAPIIMGGGPDNSIVIPAVMISQSDGVIFKNQLANGLNVTLSGTPPGTNNLDGDLDNGVIAHEYTHGISNRLTATGSGGCLSNAEEGGEGWSDYFGMMVTTNWATTALTDGPTPKYLGNYVLNNSASGSGIRNYPYSTSLTTNPLTYSHMGLGAVSPWLFSNGSEVHNIGEIWCVALWEMTWAIIAQEGVINPNLYNYNGTGGNSIALKLVLEGMKLQPCSPGFIDGRNAILAADRNLFAGRHACAIWTAFAKRGMGFGALQGNSTSTTDQTASTAMPPAPTISTQPSDVSVAAGANAVFTASAGADVNLIYRWQVSTDGGTIFNDVVPNVITPTLTLNAVTCAMNGYKYKAIVSIGCATTTTNVVTLTVTGCSSTPSITLTSAAGTNNQTACINTAITPITYSTAGGVTGATVTGLPAGVTGTYSGGTNGTVTISGTPTATGTFNYTVTTTGGAPAATATGTIIVNPTTTLTLTSAAGTTNQAITLGGAITNITYSTANGVTGATVTGLPAGVTGTYSGATNGTVTISGTPTVTGTFNYTVTTAGGCGVQTATGTITVSAGPSITLTSAAGTNNQTTCINTAITPITYSTAGGVTGATVTGLPAGVNGTYSGGTNGTVTISGTPTAAGTFSYTVTTTGGGGSATASGTIIVNPNMTITLTSAAGTTNQTVNINTAITPITYSTANGVTGATVTGLPAGVTGVYSGGTNGTVTISGTPTVAGVFNYTVTLTGGCGTATATGTITVNLVPTITLSSAAGTNNQSVCVNNAITTITYTTAGGVTGATVSGLPTGVTGTYSGGTNGTFTISGTPTVTGTFNYTVTTSGGGAPATASGTITVNGAATITLSSAAGTNNQTLCVNNAITNITYSTTGGVTGATVTGLPAGVTGTFAGSTLTISGTPTAAGTFNYTVNTSGGCGTPTAAGTITVNPASTITLTSAAGTNNQTKCINTAITSITYSTANGVTNATVTGLPAGVTGTYSGGTNGTVTISGTPTVTGTFNYTVTTSGGCGAATATGSIIVNPNATITLSSAAGTNNQTACINTAITNITYTVNTGVTGATATGLPAGVTGTFSGSTFTISGTPTATGTFNYTVTTAGGCGTATATGTIIVNPATTITLTSAAGTTNQTVCSGAALTNITYSTANGVTGATVTGLPAGITGTYSGGTNGNVTISGTPTASGVFNYTVTTTGGCGAATATGTITATAGPVITAQPQSITSCTTTATFSVTATGAGLNYVWQVSTDGGTTWTNIVPAQTGSTLVLTGLTPAQANNRYRVVITSGCGSVTSNAVTAQIGTPPVVVLTAVPSTQFNPAVQGGLFATVSPVGNYVYQWKRNGVVIPGILGPSYTPAMGLLYDFGTYTVSAIDVASGCTGISNSITLTDIQNVRSHLFISPNPTRGMIRVSFYSSTLDPKVQMISLYDQKGARVMVKNFSVSGTYGTMDLDLTNLANGTYRVVLHDASGKRIADANVLKY